MALDMNAFDAALKTLYNGQRMQDLTYKDNPFWAMLKKHEDFQGKNYPLPLNYGKPQGRSATFATAQANATSGKYEDFVLTRISDHGICTIDNEVIEASQGNSGAFVDALKSEVDGILHSLTRSLCTGLFRDQSGYIGQVKAEPNENATTFVVTLKEVNDIVNFEVGQSIVIYSAKSGGSVRTSDGSDDEWAIVAVNRNTGTITVSGTYNSSGTIEANDYIFIEGDRGNKLAGLESWLPESDPDSTLFFNVNRAVDPVRLSGVKYDGSSLPIEEALITGLAYAAREGAAPKTCFMNPLKVAELVKALGSKVEYDQVKSSDRADIGFESVRIRGPKGKVDVIPDPNCPYGVAYCLDMSTWFFKGLGKAPRINDVDGNRVLRQATNDGVEVRAVYRGQLACNAPGKNLRIKL